MSLLGTLAGTFGGILISSNLTNYRIEQLEKKVAEHNKVVERTYKLEGAHDRGGARHPGPEGGPHKRSHMENQRQEEWIWNSSMDGWPPFWR